MPRPNASHFALGLLGLSLSFGWMNQPLPSFAYSNSPAVNNSNPPNPQHFAKNCSGLLRKIFISECRERPSRGDSNPTIPYLISPVNTKIRQGQQPLIRWHRGQSDAPYQVRIAGSNRGPVTVQENYWQYPAALPLKPGWRYRVVIQQRGTACANAGVMPDCEGGFTILNDEEMVAFQLDWDRLSADERRDPLVVADVFQGHELYADAIQRLEQEVSAGAAVRDYHHFLGELYATVGLHRRALVQYELAQEFPVARDEREMRAWLNVAIGQAHWQLSEFREAVEAFEAAEVDGDVFAAEELAELRERIEMVRDRY